MGPVGSADRNRTVKFLIHAQTRCLFAVIENRRDKTFYLMAYGRGVRTRAIGGLQQADVHFIKSRLFVH